MKSKEFATATDIFLYLTKKESRNFGTPLRDIYCLDYLISTVARRL